MLALPLVGVGAAIAVSRISDSGQEAAAETAAPIGSTDSTGTPTQAQATVPASAQTAVPTTQAAPLRLDYYVPKNVRVPSVTFRDGTATRSEVSFYADEIATVTCRFGGRCEVAFMGSRHALVAGKAAWTVVGRWRVTTPCSPPTYHFSVRAQGSKFVSGVKVPVQLAIGAQQWYYAQNDTEGTCTEKVFAPVHFAARPH